MMRFECMHKVFTDKMRRTQNFKNITKSLAESYQADICMKSKKFNIGIVESKRSYNIEKLKDFDEYKSELEKYFESEIPTALQSLKYESLKFQKGLMVIDKGEILEIIHVLQNECQYYIFCLSYTLVQFDESLNSIEIKQNNSKMYRLLNIADIKTKKTYGKIYSQQKIYVITDTLDLLINLI